MKRRTFATCFAEGAAQAIAVKSMADNYVAWESSFLQKNFAKRGVGRTAISPLSLKSRRIGPWGIVIRLVPLGKIAAGTQTSLCETAETLAARGYPSLGASPRQPTSPGRTLSASKIAAELLQRLGYRCPDPERW
ncbi:hypothetical protein, partial [uncultured Rhodoblastus sp.]|uniref:hypothetical protein n=1 Tax=uncultured Rhodoblastus sp. TaxID=543037 RepID=UPI0025E36019